MLVLVALVALAGAQPGIAEVTDQEAERQLKAMMEAASQEDLENIWTNARQGDDGAQFVLGSMHENGLRVQKNLREAAKWYRLAAEQGHARAQNNFGILRSRAMDYVEDYAWWVLSAAQGNTAAAKNKDLFKRQPAFTQDVIRGQKLARKLLKRIESSKPE